MRRSSKCSGVIVCDARKSTNRKYRITKESETKARWLFASIVCRASSSAIHTFCLANACGDNLVRTHYFLRNKNEENCDCFVGCCVIIVVIGKFCMVFVLLVWCFALPPSLSSLWTSLMCAVKLKMRHTDKNERRKTAATATTCEWKLKH